MSKRDHIYRARAERFKELKAARRRKARAAAREMAWQGVGVLILAGMVLGIGWGMLEGVEIDKIEMKGMKVMDYDMVQGATSDDYALGCFGDAGARAFPVCGVVVRETLEGVTLLDVSDGWFEIYAVHVDGEFTPWVFDDLETALDWYWRKVKD